MDMVAGASRMAGGRRRVRVEGGARVTLRDDAGTTRLRELWHHDPVRVLLPEPVDDALPHVVLLNTAGGLVGGDSLRTEIEVGDRARGETIGRAWLRDRWEIRRDGRLAWADALALDPEAAGALDAPFALDGAAAMATLAYCGTDGPALLEGLREALAGHGEGIAASCVGEILLVRGLSPDAQALRRGVAAAWRFLRAAGGSLPARLPRLWHI
jgi:urease accessory protein UreH